MKKKWINTAKQMLHDIEVIMESDDPINEYLESGLDIERHCPLCRLVDGNPLTLRCSYCPLGVIEEYGYLNFIPDYGFTALNKSSNVNKLLTALEQLRDTLKKGIKIYSKIPKKDWNGVLRNKKGLLNHLIN